MKAAPSSLRYLSYAWLAESVLLLRFFRAFFSDIANHGGPDTGGLLLMFPIALAAVLLAPLFFLFGYALHQGRGLTMVKLLTGLGIGLCILIGGPLSMLMLFAVAVTAGCGYLLEAFALAGLPVLGVLTLVILHFADVRAWLDALHSGQAAGPPLRSFGKTVAIVALLAFGAPVLAQMWSDASDRVAARHAVPPISDAQRMERTHVVEAAIRADDPAPIENGGVRELSFFLPAQLEEGDALALAIELRKPNVTRLLAKQKTSAELDNYLSGAMQFSDTPIWLILIEAKARLGDDNAIAGAIERKDIDALRFVVAKGANKNSALERTVAANWLADQEQKVAFLLEAGADPNTVTNAGERVYAHDPMLVLAVRSLKTNIVRRLLAAGADAARKNSDGETALDVLAKMEGDPTTLTELRMRLTQGNTAPAH